MFDIRPEPFTASPTDIEPVLSVRDLTTSFRGEGQWQPVVRKISFDVNPCETVAIVGESGSGKSVTALSITRLLPPRFSRIEGSVRLGGRELTTLSAREMRQIRGQQIGTIFQEPMTSLNPMMTVGAQIAEALSCHGMSATDAAREALRLMERVSIPASQRRFSDFPHQFSGGMRQRVMIAMALAARPKLLIADEPTTALDVTVQSQVLDLIKSLQTEERMSVLFITHDMGVVAQMADRTVVMYRGDVVETDTTEAIFHSARHPYTRALLAAVPALGSMAGEANPLPFPKIDAVTGAPLPVTPRAETTAFDRAPILEVRNLCTRYNIRGKTFGAPAARVHAVENVSFDLHAGETLAVVGESGCGKSTLGKTLLRLTPATSGKVMFEGADVLATQGTAMRDLRQHIQMIFQDPYASLNPRIRIGAAIAEPYLAHRLGSRQEAETKVAELLEAVGLPASVASRYPHEFSGGQRQRISIARALALSPRLIVADEAVSALDVSVKAQVLNLMLDLQEKLGLAYLFISHDMAAVERISHRVAVMFMGEIVEIGPRQAVFTNPQHAYTRRLLEAVPVPDPRNRNKPAPAQQELLQSALRPADFVPPQRSYVEVSPGHLVMA